MDESEYTKERVCFECKRLGEDHCDTCNIEDLVDVLEELMEDDDFDDDDFDYDEPEPFFIAIPRTNPMFYRPMMIITPNKVDIIPRNDTTLVCDVCNAILDTEFINCATFNDGQSIWGAYCDKCRLEYQGEYPILSLEEARKRIRNGLIPNES